MPLGQRSGSGLFEYVAVVEMALVVEVGIDRQSLSKADGVFLSHR